MQTVWLLKKKYLTTHSKLLWSSCCNLIDVDISRISSCESDADILLQWICCRHHIMGQKRHVRKSRKGSQYQLRYMSKSVLREKSYDTNVLLPRIEK
jgi:hypothetical protein